ncbi:MAG: cell division protein ZipA [bacterium]
MDQDLLRLILLALGTVLVAGIYIWDRYKRVRWRAEQLNNKRQKRSPRIEPGLADLEDQEEPGFSAEEASEPEPEPLQLSEHDEVLPVNEEPEGVLDLSFQAIGDQDYLGADDVLDENVPTMVLQINLQSRGAAFRGEDILKAMKEVGLYYGAMDIYHRYLEGNSGPVLFSVASMIEPGTFPIEKMGEFRTRGLALFSQLPGVQDGLAIYSDMLFTAERLASLLDGKLQDDSHSVLSKQTIEHTREAIMEHRRKVQLARKQR